MLYFCYLHKGLHGEDRSCFSHPLAKAYPYLCGFIIVCERLRVSKGTTLCEESNLKLHYGHDSAQITGEKSPKSPQGMDHTYLSLYLSPSLWEPPLQSLHDSLLLLFEKFQLYQWSCFWPQDWVIFPLMVYFLKLGYLAMVKPKRTSEGQSTTISELGLSWSHNGVLSLRYSSRDHSSSPHGGMPINVS